jgi:hypothetical protein
VEAETHPALVIGRQEARQHYVAHHGIAHREMSLGVAQLVLIEGHRHQPELALEIGDLQWHARMALGVRLHEAGEEGHRPRRHHRQCRAADAVAALADRADVAFALDEAAVIVADVHRQPPLAEIELGR